MRGFARTKSTVVATIVSLIILASEMEIAATAGARRTIENPEGNDNIIDSCCEFQDIVENQFGTLRSIAMVSTRVSQQYILNANRDSVLYMPTNEAWNKLASTLTQQCPAVLTEMLGDAGEDITPEQWKELWVIYPSDIPAADEYLLTTIMTNHVAMTDNNTVYGGRDRRKALDEILGLSFQTLNPDLTLTAVKRSEKGSAEVNYEIMTSVPVIGREAQVNSMGDARESNETVALTSAMGTVRFVPDFPFINDPSVCGKSIFAIDTVILSEAQFPSLCWGLAEGIIYRPDLGLPFGEQGRLRDAMAIIRYGWNYPKSLFQYPGHVQIVFDSLVKALVVPLLTMLINTIVYLSPFLLLTFVIIPQSTTVMFTNTEDERIEKET